MDNIWVCIGIIRGGRRLRRCPDKTSDRKVCRSLLSASISRTRIHARAHADDNIRNNDVYTICIHISDYQNETDRIENLRPESERASTGRKRYVRRKRERAGNLIKLSILSLLGARTTLIKSAYTLWPR